MEYSIGQLARQAGYAVQTIRYYEETGLMPAPPRTMGKQRRYRKVHLDQLLFIRHARDLGFEMDDVRSLLQLASNTESSCSAVDAIASRHLDAVNAKIANLGVLRSELQRLLKACSKGQVATCKIISTLADHATCKHEMSEKTHVRF
jgi:DNA-binding transcriptional MerR regulator